MPDSWEDFGGSAGDLSPESMEGLEREVAVTLPIKYWLSALAAIGLSCVEVGERPKEMKAAGKTEYDLSDSERIALAAPIYVRPALVEMLTDEGILKPEVRERIGWALWNRGKPGAGNP